MNEESDVSQSHIVLDKHRNPTFAREEIEALIKLVEKYKTIILNKSTVSAVNHAKEAAWIKITELFNNQGFQHTRSPNCLKTKWDNLKRRAKKVSTNLMDSKYEEFDDLIHPVVALLCEAETCSNVIEVPEEIKEELKQAINEQKTDNLDKNSHNDSKQESDSDGEIEYRKMRSLNFSPLEKQFLLQCVREERKFIFTKECTKQAIQQKKKAWARVTEAFNNKSPRKRSTIVLQTKLSNMKRKVNDRYFKRYLMNKKHRKLVDEKIKREPKFDSKLSDMEQEDNNGDDSDDAMNDDFATTNPCKSAPDPINTACGSNSGDDGDIELKRNRSLNFSPFEVSVLLKCVREVHEDILSKDYSATAINDKNKAWARITAAFNKESPQKRSTKVLRTKLDNLKKNMRLGRSYFRAGLKGKSYDQLEENTMDIKAEPGFGYRSESDDNDDVVTNDVTIDVTDDVTDDVTTDAADFTCNSPRAPDPLATVLSSDSGLGSTSFIGAYNFGNNEVTKLKIELLKYQLENAKLERERLQETMRTEASVRDSLAIERSLRLRTARLEAVAAELKLPPAHPALKYTPEETPAEQYMNQYSQ